MTNLIPLDLTTLKAEELRTIAKEFQQPGAWKAKKSEMIDFLEVKKAEQIEEESRIESEAAQQQQEGKPEVEQIQRSNGRAKEIMIFKDDELVGTFPSIRQAALHLEEIIGGSLIQGVKGLAEGWEPKRGQLKGYSARYTSEML